MVNGSFLLGCVYVCMYVHGGMEWKVCIRVVEWNRVFGVWWNGMEMCLSE